MIPGPLLPLPPGFPLWQLLSGPPLQPPAGAWYRGPRRNLRLRLWSGTSRAQVLIAADLGFLLRHCTWVVVLEGQKAVFLPSELLIHWRALQVVTGTPYLPCPHRLRLLFPDAEVTDVGFRVPTRRCPPEAVLADCLAHGIPVAETHIVYRNPRARSSG